MAKHVLFVQGGAEGAYEADAKLAASLREALGAEYEVRYPAMPNEDDAAYAAWKDEILMELDAIGDGAILVGHSIGASVLVKLFTEEDREIAGLFLIAAPFWREDDTFWRWKDVQLAPNPRLLRGAPMFFYHGRDDEVAPFAHLECYARAFPDATMRALAGRNHQLNDDMSEIAEDIRRLDR